MSEVSPIFHPRHFAGLATALPFMFVPVIYGLAPRLTAPAAATLLALWVTAVLIVNAGKNQNPGIEKVPLLCFLLTAIGLYLALISRHAPSAAKESGLATASVVLYVSALSAYSFDADHDLLRFTIMAGGWFVACVFIGVRIFYPASGIDGIALSNANILAMHMALLLPCSLASCWRSKTRQERLFFALMAATYSITLLLTRSFGVILALILAAAVIIYQARAYIALLAGIKKLPKVAATALILGCLAAVAVKAVKHPESFSDRLKWQGSALAMFADSPLTGNIYKGGFFSLYPLYKPSRIELNTNFSHNVYLELLSHWGVVGGILFVFLIFAWRQFLPSRLPMELKTTLFIVFITGFYDSNITIMPNLLAFLGLMASHIKITGFRVEGSAGNGVRSSFVTCYNKLWPPFSSCQQVTNEDLTPLPALPFLLGIILAVIVTAGSFQLTLSRYHLVRGGIWAMWAHYMPEISQEVHLSIRRSLRWDNLDPEAWSDLAKLEYALSAKAPVRRAWAAWAADRAHRLEPYRKTYAKLIKIIKKNDSIP